MTAAQANPPAADPSRAYHHGALRQALIEAAETVLTERGAEGFTLRECARRAGVSPAAPAHHFGNVTGLLTAIAAEGFDHLADAMDTAAASADAAAGARLHAIGAAYIAEALAHPARFRVTFGRMALDRGNPALVAASSRAFAILAREVGALVDPRRSDGHPEIVFAWSAVHGFATLLLDRHLGPGGGPEPDASADGLLRLLVRGLVPR